MAVVIETTIGDFTVDLFTEERPRTCLNFLKLCKIKYYNFCLFHSVQNNFIAQTGDPTGSGISGESIYAKVYGDKAKYYEGEQVPKMKHHKAGLLSMVNCGNNMFGSQFFITLAKDLQSLDSEHCIFGEITEGLEVILKLNETICDQDHRPFQDIRITHTVILEDPFDDPAGLVVPEYSPEPTKENLQNGRIAPDEEIDETKGLSTAEIEEMQKAREAKAQATILEIVGDLPDAEMAPPENVLFVCKLNPVTTDADLEIIFSRFGKIKSCEVIRDKTTGDSLQYAFIEFEERKSCEDAYFKMDNVLIDDRRIHVDFSQSVAKLRWKGKGRGVEHLDEQGNVRKDPGDQYYNKYDNNKTSQRGKEKLSEDGWDIEELSSVRRGHRRGSSERDRSGRSSKHRSRHRSRSRSRSRDRHRRERGSSHREERKRRDNSATPSKGSKREDESVSDRRDKHRRSKERTKDDGSKHKSSDADVEKLSKHQRHELKDGDNKKSNTKGGKESEACEETDQKKPKDRNTSKNGTNKHQRDSESCDEVAQKKQDEDRKEKRSEARNVGSSDKITESCRKDGQKVNKSNSANEDLASKNTETNKVKETKLSNDLKKSNSVESQSIQEESSSKSKHRSKNELNNGTSSMTRESQKDGDRAVSKSVKKINEKKLNKSLDGKKRDVVNERGDAPEKTKDRKRRKEDVANEKSRKKVKRHSSSSSDADSSSVSDSSGDSDSDSSSSSSSSSYDAKKVRKKKHPKKATVVAKKAKKKRKLKKKLHRKKESDSDCSSSDSSHSRKGKKKYKGKRKRKSSTLQDDSNSDVGRKRDKKKKKVLLKRKRKNSSSDDSSSECESSSSSSSSSSTSDEPRRSKKKLRKMKMFDKKIRRLQKQWQKAKNNLSRKDLEESGSESSSDDVAEVDTDNRKGSHKNSTSGVPKKVKRSSKADHGSVH